MPRLNPTVVIGKSVRTLARIRGGGSALPGLIVEKLQPTFLKDVLSQLPKGIVVVTGTNGKTTTAKIITELLVANGLKVFTNPTGSNFTRGIVAAVIEHINNQGQLDFDIAVIELDEAYAKRFVQTVRPDYVIALNVMRDQLDRFGELDSTAKLIEPVLAAAKKARVVNYNDPLLAPIGKELDKKSVPTFYFGVDTSLRSMFPSDDELQFRGQATPLSATQLQGDVELAGIKGQQTTYRFGKHTASATLSLQGLYNFQNAAGALAIVRAILPKVKPEQLVEQLAHIQPAFGRGEVITVNGVPIELVLVKNPAGFRLSLASFIRANQQYMIAINDDYADGRDMSWLWDIEFEALQDAGVAVVSGVRAYDMALRLQYDDVLIGSIDPSIAKSVKKFVLSNEQTPKVIYASYTAMLKIRKQLTKYATVERVL